MRHRIETAVDEQARVEELEPSHQPTHSKRQDQLELVLSTFYKLLFTASFEAIIDAVIAQAQVFTQSVLGCVAILDPATGNLISPQIPDLFREYACGMSEDKRGTVFVRNVDGSYPCLWGHALNTCQGFYTNAPAAHPASRGGAIPFQRFLAVPIVLDQEPAGEILLANARRNYTGRDIEAVERLSDVIAQAVRRERIEDERERKMRDLSSFAHTVAHDLKNPLAVMLSALDMIRDELPGDYPRLSQYLDIGVQSAERMNAIVDELLLFASVRDQDMPIARVPMQECVAHALQDLSHMSEHYQAEIMINCTWPEVLGHAPWIERVWVNYISNAIKYGGSPPMIELGADPLPGGWVRFWVRDNGWGIPPEDIDSLFKPFKRRSRHTDGYGLGLSIVQRIVEKLGGRVSLESTVGQGSVFSFTLMAAQHD